MSRGSSLNLLYCRQFVEERLDRRLQEAEHVRMVRAADGHQDRGLLSAMARLKALLFGIRQGAARSSTSPAR
jgi:hypothetical protein